MSKLMMVALCAFLLTAGTAFADSDLLKTGGTYQAVFSADYRSVHNMDSNNQYFIKILAISKSDPNWVLISFPPNANPSYSSSLAGQRWLNLNYVIELMPYKPLPGQ